MVELKPLIVLDRDGVINADSDDYIKSACEWQPLPGSLAAIAALAAAGHAVVVVSNQSGIARGLFDRAALAAIHAKMIAMVAAAGGHLDGIYYCPHAPGDGCNCRKPLPGLLQNVQRDFSLPNFEGVPVIGDKASDLALAERVGARPILVRTGKGRETEAAVAGAGEAEVFDDLAHAARALLAASPAA